MKFNFLMAAIDKVKIIVVGDSGVGKTSLTHLICQQQPISNPSWTVGCSVEVKLHEYREGTPNQRRYFIELWDVGGSQNHKNTRSVFYNPTNVGIILVHDLTNRKSQQNLQKWLEEVLNKDGTFSKSKSFDDFDPEKFVGLTHIPILVIGTKLDLIPEVKSNVHRRSSTIAEECGADEIFLDCRQIRSLAAGSSSSVKLSRFFDKVIERRYYASREGFNLDKRRPPLYSSSVYTKSYHND
ncbi:rab-like protein 3 isoform X1 [Harpegnathos saltator]|uniref:rab-like protein 3 isoform X1 n=1 Tax=Harpegnathos saltator TaxID=610380 RepID=UPI000590543B|nr:rab-like protein 3 isoform X1 [Harpegnathos saltator]